MDNKPINNSRLLESSNLNKSLKFYLVNKFIFTIDFIDNCSLFNMLHAFSLIIITSDKYTDVHIKSRSDRFVIAVHHSCARKYTFTLVFMTTRGSKI